MDIKLKNTTKILFIISVVIFCTIAGIVANLPYDLSVKDIFEGTEYNNTNKHKKEIIKDINDIIQLESGYNKKKDMRKITSLSSYSYFYAHHYYFTPFIRYKGNNVSQRNVFQKMEQQFNKDTSVLIDTENEDYTGENLFMPYILSTSYILSSQEIADKNNTYVVRGHQIYSDGRYTNYDINYKDLNLNPAKSSNLLLVISYPDDYLEEKRQELGFIYAVLRTLIFISAAVFVYIIYYIQAVCRKNLAADIKSLATPPKYPDLVIISAAIIVPACIALYKYIFKHILPDVLSLRQILFALTGIIIISFICHILPPVVYSIKNKTFFQSFYFVGMFKFIQRNKKEISASIKKLSVIKKPFIWIINIITGRKYIVKGAPAVEKFIFRYSSLIVIIISVLMGTVIYNLNMMAGYTHYNTRRQVMAWLPGNYNGTAIKILNITAVLALVIYLLVFIFYHYRTQKILQSFFILEKQIEKMYTGDYQIDSSAGKGTIAGKDIQMLAQIGSIFEKNLEDKIKMERTKVELVTNVSHDLKTPLTSIISYIDLLDHETTIPPEAKNYVKILMAKADRLKQIVNEVFELAMTTSGEIQVKHDVLSLNKLIIQTVADMEDRINSAGIEVKQQLEEKDIFITSDGDRMYRVLQNLIDNALKYSLKGTRIYIQESHSGEYAYIRIKNTANYEMHFTKEDVMERFFRGDKSRNSEGNGLGLSIAQGFTIACGGTFDVKIDGDQFNVIISFPVTQDGNKNPVHTPGQGQKDSILKIEEGGI